MVSVSHIVRASVRLALVGPTYIENTDMYGVCTYLLSVDRQFDPGELDHIWIKLT